MRRVHGTGTTPRPNHDTAMPMRIAQSVLAGAESGAEDLDRWLDELRSRRAMQVRQVGLDQMEGWSTDQDTGVIRHDSGRFFTIEGLEVHIPGAPVPRWSQPIISQPEVGILGFLVKQFDGVLHCLVQGKTEPGNYHGLQICPTVQATRSNYTKVHGGRSVPYLEYFQDPAPHRVIADVRQSEQGAWFRQKRNRNMIVEATEDVQLLDGFRWVTLGQLHWLLQTEDLVNMDARTVLSCMPFAGPGLVGALLGGRDGFHDALLASCSDDRGSLHQVGDILSWVTEARSHTDIFTREVPLKNLPGWRRAGGSPTSPGATST